MFEKNKDRNRGIEMAGYLFLSNSNKPTDKEQYSRENVKLTNVSRPCLEIALDMGYDVWFGTNRDNPYDLECELPVKMYDSHTYRSLFNLRDNYIAYKNLMYVLKHNDIEVIHCNTPIGGIMGRICGKIVGVKTVIYTAHGFHFYKGAPLINRTVFKWAEMLMAHWTDAIITMNQEDFNEAKKFKLRDHGKVFYTPGVGIDCDAYKDIKVNRKEIREALGVSDTDVVCISMGDLIPRKNYETALKALGKCKNKNIHYWICGQGPELNTLNEIVRKENITDRVHFLGFRTDVKELLKAADIFLFTTLQEGMPRSMMEAMASGLPCIASKIRGNVDLLEEGIGGYLVETRDIISISEKIDKLVENSMIRKQMGIRNLERIKNFDIKEVKKVICKIYQEVLGQELNNR